MLHVMCSILRHKKGEAATLLLLASILLMSFGFTIGGVISEPQTTLLQASETDYCGRDCRYEKNRKRYSGEVQLQCVRESQAYREGSTAKEIWWDLEDTKACGTEKKSLKKGLNEACTKHGECGKVEVNGRKVQLECNPVTKKCAFPRGTEPTNTPVPEKPEPIPTEPGLTDTPTPTPFETPPTPAAIDIQGKIYIENNKDSLINSTAPPVIWLCSTNQNAQTACFQSVRSQINDSGNEAQYLLESVDITNLYYLRIGIELDSSYPEGTTSKALDCKIPGLNSSQCVWDNVQSLISINQDFEIILPASIPPAPPASTCRLKATGRLLKLQGRPPFSSYVEIDDLDFVKNVSYSNDNSAVVNFNSAISSFGPFTLPTGGYKGSQQSDEQGKDKITYTLLNYNSDHYKLAGSRFKTCDLDSTNCSYYTDGYDEVIRNVPLDCGKTIEFDWLFEELSDPDCCGDLTPTPTVTAAPTLEKGQIEVGVFIQKNGDEPATCRLGRDEDSSDSLRAKVRSNDDIRWYYDLCQLELIGTDNSYRDKVVKRKGEGDGCAGHLFTNVPFGKYQITISRLKGNGLLQVANKCRVQTIAEPYYNYTNTEVKKRADPRNKSYTAIVLKPNKSMCKFEELTESACEQEKDNTSLGKMSKAGGAEYLCCLKRTITSGGEGCWCTRKKQCERESIPNSPKEWTGQRGHCDTPPDETPDNPEGLCCALGATPKPNQLPGQQPPQQPGQPPPVLPTLPTATERSFTVNAGMNDIQDIISSVTIQLQITKEDSTFFFVDSKRLTPSNPTEEFKNFPKGDRYIVRLSDIERIDKRLALFSDFNIGTFCDGIVSGKECTMTTPGNVIFVVRKANVSSGKTIQGSVTVYNPDDVDLKDVMITYHTEAFQTSRCFRSIADIRSNKNQNKGTFNFTATLPEGEDCEPQNNLVWMQALVHFKNYDKILKNPDPYTKSFSLSDNPQFTFYIPAPDELGTVKSSRKGTVTFKAQLIGNIPSNDSITIGFSASSKGEEKESDVSYAFGLNNSDRTSEQYEKTDIEPDTYKFSHSNATVLSQRGYLYTTSVSCITPDCKISLLPTAAQTIEFEVQIQRKEFYSAYFNLSNLSEEKTVNGLRMTLCSPENQCFDIERDVSVLPGRKKAVSEVFDELGRDDNHSLTCTLLFSDGTQSECPSADLELYNPVTFDLSFGNQGQIQSKIITESESADVNSDGANNVLDIAFIFANWGTPNADSNGDGITNSLDSAIAHKWLLLSN